MADEKKLTLPKEKKPNKTLEKAKKAITEGRIDEEYPARDFRDFSGMNMSGRDLTKMGDEIDNPLNGADKVRHLKNADFRNADLSGAKLDGVILQGAMFQGANLTGASLVGCDIRWANFSNADLTDTDFTDALLGLQGEVVGI